MDIDIDFKTTFDPRKLLPQAVPASMVRNGTLVKHACGHYFQTMPVDPHTQLAAIPYKDAEELGFFKIDLLHLSALDHFKSKSEIRELLTKEPKWSILQDEAQVAKLFQIHRHADLLKVLKPKSVQALADCIALIRPGKCDLLEQYIEDPEATRPLLYKRSDDGYYFKRSHAISYALTITLQLHLIERGDL